MDNGGKITNVKPKAGYTLDGLVNVMSGRGTSVDKRVHNHWYFQKRTPYEVLSAYRTSWLMSKIVDLPAQDMTREWREWQSDDASSLMDIEKRLNLKAKFELALTYGRLGGGAIIIGLGDDASQPLTDKPIKYLHVVTRYELAIGPIDRDVESDNFGEPEYFSLNYQGGGQNIHPSRVIVFKGEKVPNMGLGYHEDVFWGDSIIDRIDSAVKNAEATSDGFASLVDEAKLDTYKFAGLADLISSEDGDEKAITRLQAMNSGKSTHRGRILDKDDDWEQKQITWAGMPDMIAAYYGLVAGAADIPVTRLLGKSAQGMNATGEGDEKNYLSMIATAQESKLRPALERLDPLLISEAKASKTTTWEFAALDMPNEKERAEIENKQADTISKLEATNLIPESALAKSVHQRMIQSGQWPALEEALNELPDIEDLGTPDSDDFNAS